MLYQKLFDEIAAQIRNGTFQHAEKLPSVRGFATQKKVSVSTVLMAYRQLEDSGLVEVRPKSGYYVTYQPLAKTLAVPKLKQNTAGPKKVTSSQLVMEVMRGSAAGNYLSLGAAMPANDFAILDELKQSFARLVRSKQFLGIGYESSIGHETLRLQIARRSAEAGIHVAADEVVVTAGCQGALGLCLRAVCSPGDIVAVESPAYYGLLQLIESSGLRVIEIPSEAEQGISIDALRLALEQWPIKAILTVSSFSNPLGALIPESSRIAMLELAKAYDIPIIEDDIYGDLSYAPVRPKAIKAFDEEGRVLMCSSASKILEPQLGLGWVLPGRYMEQIEYQRFLTNTGLFALPQMALAQVLSKAAFSRHLRHAREVYRQRRDRLAELVAEHFPEGTTMTQPKGGFVAWLQLPGNIHSTDYYLKAKEAGIVIAPGSIFSSNPDKFRNAIRLSYANDWNAARCQAVAQLGSIAKVMAAGG